MKIIQSAALVVPVLLSVALTVMAAQGQSPDTALIEKGRVAYDYWCATCHAAGMPGTTALAAKYKDGSRPAVLRERVDLTPQLLRFVVRNGASVMPFFRKTEASEADLEAIAAYLTRRGAK
jgi:mono/diheme cytochrome c family protein